MENWQRGAVEVRASFYGNGGVTRGHFIGGGGFLFHLFYHFSFEVVVF